jgi:hypothetical protein
MSSRFPGLGQRADAIVEAIHNTRDPVPRAHLAAALAQYHPLTAADLLSVSADPVVITAITDVIYDRLRGATSSTLSETLAKRLMNHHLLPGNLPLTSPTRVRLARFLSQSHLLLYLLSMPDRGGARHGEGAALFTAMKSEPFDPRTSGILPTLERMENIIMLWFASSAVPRDGINQHEFTGFLHQALPDTPSSALLVAKYFQPDGPNPTIAALVQSAIETYPTGCTSPRCQDPDRRAARSMLLRQIAENNSAPISASISASHTLICLD